MAILLIDIKYLQKGCIITKDVLGKTNHPIVKQSTIIDGDLLDVLHAFLVREVSVANTLADGTRFIPKEIIKNEDNDSVVSVEISFHDAYLQAVEDYQKLFKYWQAGAHIDVTAIRKIFVPLLERALKADKEIFTLYQYSSKDEYFYHHAISVGLICGYLGKKLNFSKGDIVQVALAGCLSDAGMARVPLKILEKPTPLTSEEFLEIKKHPMYGFSMLQKSSTLKKDVILAILQHHERLDGSGYPKGEKSSNIHMFSRILAVADVFHAMTCERLHRKKQSSYKVIETIKQDEFGKYDLNVLNALMAGAVQLTIGTRVKLSNGLIGQVMYMNSRNPLRPLIRLEETDELIDLERKRDIFIIETY